MEETCQIGHGLIAVIADDDRKSQLWSTSSKHSSFRRASPGLAAQTVARSFASSTQEMVRRSTSSTQRTSTLRRASRGAAVTDPRTRSVPPPTLYSKSRRRRCHAPTPARHVDF